VLVLATRASANPCFELVSGSLRPKTCPRRSVANRLVDSTGRFVGVVDAYGGLVVDIAGRQPVVFLVTPGGIESNGGIGYDLPNCTGSAHIVLSSTVWPFQYSSGASWPAGLVEHPTVLGDSFFLPTGPVQERLIGSLEQAGPGPSCNGVGPHGACCHNAFTVTGNLDLLAHPFRVLPAVSGSLSTLGTPPFHVDR
jgi:hypothetical protein